MALERVSLLSSSMPFIMFSFDFTAPFFSVSFPVPVLFSYFPFWRGSWLSPWIFFSSSRPTTQAVSPSHGSALGPLLFSIHTHFPGSLYLYLPNVHICSCQSTHPGECLISISDLTGSLANSWQLFHTIAPLTVFPVSINGKSTLPVVQIKNLDASLSYLYPLHLKPNYVDFTFTNDQNLTTHHLYH